MSTEGYSAVQIGQEGEKGNKGVHLLRLLREQQVSTRIGKYGR